MSVNDTPATVTPPVTTLPLQHWQADACLLVTALIWGVNIPVVKVATHTVDALVFNAVRMVFSVGALAILAWIETRRRSFDFKQVAWPRVLTFSLFSGLIYPSFFMFGIDRTTSANAALLLTSMPMWTAVLSWIFLKEKLARITWFGLLITFFGTSIVVGAKGELNLGGQYLVGNLFMLAAAITWASATVISRPLLRQIGPIQLAFISSAFTTPIHLLIVSGQLPASQQALLEPGMIACLFYSGALSTGLAYGAWNFGVQRLGGSHAAVYQNIVTLVAVLGGWLVLGEPRLTAQWIGGALTIAGLFIMRSGRR